MNRTVAQTVAQIIYCPRSGLPLAKVEALCSQGWPMLNSMASTTSGLIHPIYNVPLSKLVIKLKSELQAAEAASWDVPSHQQHELALTMSAIMYSLDCMWQPPVEAVSKWMRIEPSLPAWPICVASGGRLLSLAGWYHFATSKRLSFPLYRTSTANKNTEWQNFSAWLDDAFSVRTEWESKKSAIAQAEELKARTDALITVRADAVYKRIDLGKVWKWVDIQLAQDKRYSAGRRETFKSIFMSADMHPEEWAIDDIEDVQLAILECCDMGNDIMHFITQRINMMRASLQDFYSSFTLLTKVAGDSSMLDTLTEEEAVKTGEFFSGFDKRAESLESLPPEPKREHFATHAKFLQAQAQHRILARRYDMSKSRTSAGAALQATAQDKQDKE